MLARLYFAHAGEMGATGPLPFAGGLADQPAWAVHAFEIIGAAVAALRKEPRFKHLIEGRS